MRPRETEMTEHYPELAEAIRKISNFPDLEGYTVIIKATELQIKLEIAEQLHRLADKL